MFKFLSRRKKNSPEALSPDAIEGILNTLEGLTESVQQNISDIINLNTAINRVERKQNRWLEVLNERELESLPGDGKKPLDQPAPEVAFQAGEPTEI